MIFESTGHKATSTADQTSTADRHGRPLFGEGFTRPPPQRDETDGALEPNAKEGIKK